MSEPTFSQPQSRSLLIPILLALVVLGAALLVATHFFPTNPIHLTLTHTKLLPTHTVFKSDSIVLAADHAEDALFVASTVRIENQQHFPVSLDDFSLTFTASNGAELTTKAVQRQDLPNIELTFPALKPLVPNALGRETTIAPGQAAEGIVLFSLPIPPATWDNRTSAIIKVDLYHQKSLYQTIPKLALSTP